MEVRSRARKALCVVAAALMYAAALVGTAGAHIGVSHTPLETDGPDLVTVARGAGALTYCFDEEVGVLGIDADFHASGYNTTGLADGTAILDVVGSCVVIEYAEGNVNGFGVATVEPDVVEDTAGNTNFASAASIGGSTLDGGLGRTAAPNLVSHTVNTGAQTITYTFDTVLDCGRLLDSNGNDPGNFGFYEGNGTRWSGDNVTGCDGNSATVVFTGGTNNVARVFVRAPAGSDEVCEGGIGFVCTHLEAIGTATALPDLIDATRAGPITWTFSFDTDVTINDSSKFFIYEDSGARYMATSCSLPGSAGNVNCDFLYSGMAESTNSELPIAAVDDGAANVGSDMSTVGHSGVGSSQEDPGRTAGPDLEAVTIDEGDDEASFEFDEPVDPGSVTASGDFALITEAGTAASGVGATTVAGDTVTMSFPSDVIGLAVGGRAGDGAVRDFLGSGNLLTVAGEPDTGGGGGGGGGGGDDDPTDTPNPTPSGSGTDASPSPGPSSSDSPNPSGPPECADDVDNDGDGATDADDGQCESTDDDDESGPAPQCGTEGVVCGTSSDDNIQGTAADEIIIGGGGDDTCAGGGGDDVLFCGAGNDILRGGSGNDFVRSIWGRDQLFGGVGLDKIHGGLGNDKIVGGAGNDNLVGEGGFDELDGGGGRDRCVGGTGDEKLESCEVAPKFNF